MDLDLLIKNIHDYIIVDVRSPSEYLKGHIPFSINIALFSDEERKIVGTIYKQRGKKEAIEQGLNLVNLPRLVQEFRTLPKKPIILYCARGGMRSSSIGWLLGLLDYNIQILGGGYKTFRRWVLDQFNKQYKLKIIGGYTGVGKTKIIEQLNHSINLEAMANHNGSVFGGFEKNQPTQEHFENLLAVKLFSLSNHSIFIENESRFIGRIRIPDNFYNQMQNSSVIVLQDLLENRIKRCILEYKNAKKEDLKSAIKKLEKKLGSEAIQKAATLIDEGKYEEVCVILFSYYDKCYNFCLSKREPKNIFYLEISNKPLEEICASIQDRI